MANTGYIGKISALVTASTADLERKLRGATGDVTRFGRSLSSTLAAASRSSQQSLNGIFTPLQRLERTIRAASNSRLELLKPGQAAELRSFVSAAEGINKPLESARRQFTGLSSEVATNFAPALVRAQNEAIALNEQISRTGVTSRRQFQQAQQAVDEYAQAQARLTQIDRAARSGLTGREAEFVSPRALQTLREAAALSERASRLPPAQLEDGSVARQVQRLQTFRDAIARTVAEVEEIRLRPQVDEAALSAAEQRLNNIIRTTRRAQEQLEQVVNRAADAQRRAQAASSLLQVDQRESQLTSLEGQASTRDASGRTIQERAAAINATRERAQAEAELRSEQERRIAVANTLLQVDQRESQLTSLQGQASTRDASGRTIQERVAAIAGSDEFARISAAADAAAQRITSLAQATETALGGARPTIDSLEKEFRDLLSTLGSTQGVQADTFEPLTREILELFAAAIDGKGGLEEIGQKINELRTQSAGAKLNILSDVEVQADRAAAALQKVTNSRNSLASRLEEGFGGAGAAGLELGIDSRQLRAIEGEFEFLQNRIQDVSATARGPLVAAMQRYREVTVRAFRDGTASTEQGRRAIAKAREEVVRLAADVLKVRPARLGQQLKRAGDIGRAGFGNLSLGIQQAAFAIDDFFSVTGGLDQRIRAAGNNISQLGFILGGTTGLIAGIAVSIGSQLVASLIRWIQQTDEAEERQKRLAQAISQVNNALERQREIADSVAQSYRSIGEALADAGLSEAGREQRRRDRQVEGIQDQQRERRREIAAGVSTRVSGARAEVARLEEQLQTETDLGVRESLTAQLRIARNLIESELDRIETGAQIQINQAQRDVARGFALTPAGALSDRRSGIQSRLDAAFRERRQLVSENQPTNVVDNEIEKLTATLAQIEVAIASLRDAQGVSAISSARQASDLFAGAQGNLSGIRGFSTFLQEAELFSRQIENVLTDLSEGEIDATAARRLIDGFLENAEATNRASIAVGRFADSLDEAARSLALTVESELGSESQTLRRRANAAAASPFGQEESELLRNAQERITAAQLDAQAERQQIDAQIETARRRFEDEFRLGVADQRALELASQIQASERIAADQTERPEDRDAARLRAARLREELDTLFSQDPTVQGLRDRADQVDIQAQRERQQVEAAIRGRELSQTPGERAARSLTQGLEDIRQFFGQQAEATTGLVDFEAQSAAQQRLIDETLRSTAPAIFGLADQVQNAVLSGPSRAALQATDVSTVEGNRELNRLIRGDDAARNQDLVELQKQSQALEELVRIAREEGVPIAD
jgi:hypothetical protein